MDLTDEQWAVVKPFIPIAPKRADGKGRPRADDRCVWNGILWIMRTGAAWHDLPDRYPSPATCHRRFQAWCRSGLFEQMLEALAQDLEERGPLDLSECFIDGTFVSAKKGALRGQDQARQRSENHGNCRPHWPSCRRLRIECYTA